MLRSDFDFDLPPELIAQRPALVRSGSRLLAVDGESDAWRDLSFRDLASLLKPGDLLVFNDTRVVPARVHGTKESGGKVEILLERALDSTTALVHARASKGLKAQAVVSLPGGVSACMLGREGDLFRLRFSKDVLAFFAAHGDMPLPPYVDRPADAADRDRYQTVYARTPGAVAAPTAGLHFDAEVFAELEARGIGHAFVTLHVGAGTFQPVRVENIDEHVMHEEFVDVPETTVQAIAAARAAGGRVIAVGTTVVRSLETAAGGLGADSSTGAESPTSGSTEGTSMGARASAYSPATAIDGGAHAARTAVGTARADAPLRAYRGRTRIFIKPGYRFRLVDALVTNFHLPQSTLLMLCSAFVGRERLLAAYRHAIEQRYRFFSYGDAMFLVPTAAARVQAASAGTTRPAKDGHDGRPRES